MGRKSKKNADVAVATETTATDATVKTENPGVGHADTFTLGGENPAHSPVGVPADLPTAHVDPAEVLVEFDPKVIAAVDQHEKDVGMAVDIFIRGQRQPAVVYKDDLDGKLCMITGRTRRRAVQMIREGFTAIDPRTNEAAKFHNPDLKLWVAIDSARNKEDAFVLDLTTQIKHSSLTPIQEAYAIQRLIASEADKGFGWSLTDAAKFFGYNNTNRQNKLLRVLAMEQSVIEKVHAGLMAVDAAITVEGLKPEQRLLLIERATDPATGEVDGGRLKELVRNLFSQGDEAVQNDTGKEDETEGDDEPKEPKGASLARNTSKLKAFIEGHVSDDESKLPEPAKELLKAFGRWITGVKFGDTALTNALLNCCKSKFSPKSE